MYVIGGRLLVHCTEGNCSLEVPLSEVYLYIIVLRIFRKLYDFLPVHFHYLNFFLNVAYFNLT